MTTVIPRRVRSSNKTASKKYDLESLIAMQDPEEVERILISSQVEWILARDFWDSTSNEARKDALKLCHPDTNDINPEVSAILIEHINKITNSTRKKIGTIVNHNLVTEICNAFLISSGTQELFLKAMREFKGAEFKPNNYKQLMGLMISKRKNTIKKENLEWKSEAETLSEIETIEKAFGIDMSDVRNEMKLSK